MSKALIRTPAAVANLSVTPPPDQAAVSVGGGAVAISWPAHNQPGGAVVTGGRLPYTVIYTPANGSSFAVGTTPVTVDVYDVDGRTDSAIFNVVVSTPDPDPGPDPLVVTAPSNVTVLSLDGNPVVASWSASVVAGGVQPYTRTYKESGVDKTSGVSTFAVGVHTLTAGATDSDNPASSDSDTFTITVNEASGGDIAEVRTEHPMLGVVGAAGVSTLRTRLLNASYGEKAYLQALVNELPTRLSSAALGLASTGTTVVRNAVVGWGAINCAYLSMLDPAALRTGGIAFTTGFPFTTASARTITSTCTQADLAILALDLLTKYYLNHRNPVYSLPYVEVARAGAIQGLSDQSQHSFAANTCLPLYLPIPVVWDWCYNALTEAQRLEIANPARNDALNMYTVETFNPGATSISKPAPSALAGGDFGALVGAEEGSLFLVGNQTAWFYCLHALTFLPMLNDPEFGTAPQKAEIWALVRDWMTQLGREVALFNGRGYHHQEALIRYAADALTQLLNVAMLSRTAFLDDDPWTQIETAVQNLAPCLSLIRHENERGVNEEVIRMHTMPSNAEMHGDGDVSHLYYARNCLLQWGDDQDAEDCQWLIETVGHPSSEQENTNRWYQAVMRHGLLTPYRHLTPAGTPASFNPKQGGGLTIFTDPTSIDNPQVIFKSRQNNHISAHAESNPTTLHIACGGVLINGWPCEVKSGPYEVSVPGKEFGGSQMVVRLTSTQAQVAGGSNTSAGFGAPFTGGFDVKACCTDDYCKTDHAQYGFVQVTMTDAFDKNTTDFTAWKKFRVYLKDLRVVVEHDLVEGIPALNNIEDWIWVTAAPTWIGGTVTARPGMATVNGFEPWYESADAIGWEIENYSNGDWAEINNRLSAGHATHAKAYITSLLPVTGRALHARGGTDWLTATPIFKAYQNPTDTGTAYAIPAGAATTDATGDAHNWRTHAWGRLAIRGTGSSQRHLKVIQFGHRGSGEPYYVGTRVACTVIQATDVDVMHYPHATTPAAVIFPNTVAKTNSDKDFTFDIAVPVATKFYFIGSVGAAGGSVGVSAASLGGGNWRITVAASGAFTASAEGSLLVTCSTGGVIS